MKITVTPDSQSWIQEARGRRGHPRSHQRSNNDTKHREHYEDESVQSRGHPRSHQRSNNETKHREHYEDESVQSTVEGTETTRSHQFTEETDEEIETLDNPHEREVVLIANRCVHQQDVSEEVMAQNQINDNHEIRVYSHQQQHECLNKSQSLSNGNIEEFQRTLAGAQDMHVTLNGIQQNIMAYEQTRYIPLELFKELFPYHVVFNDKLLISQCGNKITMFCPEVKPGVHLDTVCEVKYPRIPLEYKELLDFHTGQLVMEFHSNVGMENVVVQGN